LPVPNMLPEGAREALGGPAARWQTAQRRPRGAPASLARKVNGKLGEKSVHNLKGVLSSVFALAVFEGVMDRNPCAQIPRGKLPRIGKQKRPLYDRDEAWALMTDPRVPPDRRVFHTVQGLTGLRVGEVAGLRWRDYDASAKPLGALHVHCQYDGQPLKTASGADTKARMVPVHPELAKVLSKRRSQGFSSVYGRLPTEEDFIVDTANDQWFRSQTPCCGRYPKLVARDR